MPRFGAYPGAFAVAMVAIATALLVGGTATATTITVNSTSDDPTMIGRGVCMLRNAIIAANTNAVSRGCAAGSGPGDVINFDLGPGNPVINVGESTIVGSAGPLPEITEGMTIDGATGGATRVVLHSAGTGNAGLKVDPTAPGTTIRHLVINNFFYGVLVEAANVAITGSFIGTDASGTVAAPNSSAGIEVIGPGASAVIGGTAGTTPGGACTGDCNLVAGNPTGVSVGGFAAGVPGGSASIVGNSIGTNLSGDAALPNGDGIRTTYIDGAVTIGGSVAAARNLISGNSSNGVRVLPSSLISISGNFIGTDTTGTSALGNGAVGVNVESGSPSAVHIGGTIGTTPGGACTGDCNLISGNGVGVLVRDGGAEIQGNFVGTNAAGTAAIPNGPATGTYGGSGVAIIIAHVTVGGVMPGAGNVISGNQNNGLYINAGPRVDVMGNRIGTDSSGTAPVPNLASGVATDAGAPDSDLTASIGGVAAGSGNIIAFNGVDGVMVSNESDRLYSAITIRGNSIHDNANLGIEIVPFPGAPLLPPPAISQANASISGTGCANCLIDVYADAAEEGRTFLGTATAGAAGDWNINVGASGPHITATTTDAYGATSQFSPPFSCPDFDHDALCDGVDDVDHDGIVDALDDCITTPDPNQRDSNGDGYGNVCDADLNNDGAVNFSDLALFRQRFGTPDPDADLNGDGPVNFADLALFRSMFGRPPGPSGRRP